MARRKSRKGKKGASSPLLVGAVVVVLVLVGYMVSSRSSSRGKASQTNSLRIADYRQDGSRLVGNRYLLTGRVENIETIGNNRVLAISMKNNPQERLPLLLPAEAKLQVNITRGDTFVFDVQCKNGRAENGGQVKGILVIQGAEVK